MQPQEKDLNIFWAFIAFDFLVFLDLLTKHLGFSLQDPIHFGIINFIPVKNFGLVFGSFVEFKNLVRVVFFSTTGGYAIALFFVILYFLQNKPLFWLKLSITIFVAGIVGNVVDKTFLGFVRDFLNVGFAPFEKYAFNVADIYLFVGTCMTIFFMHAHGDRIWKANNNRKTFLINKHYQFTLGFWNIAALLLVCITLSFYSYSFLKSYIDPHVEVEDQIYRYFFLGILLIVFLYLLIFFLFTIILTHRSAGPIIALERYVEELEKGESTSSLKLRKGDFHMELEALADKIKNLKNTKTIPIKESEENS